MYSSVSNDDETFSFLKWENVAKKLPTFAATYSKKIPHRVGKLIASPIYEFEPYAIFTFSYFTLCPLHLFLCWLPFKYISGFGCLSGIHDNVAE